MSVGLLIITHNKIGANILATAEDILGHSLPMKVEVIEVKPDSPYDAKLAAAKKSIQELDSGDGVLVLTDIFGATPCNIATKAANGSNTQVIAGINLPMIVRVLNYHDLPLKKLAAKANSAGHDGIIES